jgi:hypothetical protein
MLDVSEPSPCTRWPFSRTQLEKLGVRICNRYDLCFECLTCGEVWSPQLYDDDTLPRGYWRCPNRCNW